MTSWHRAIESEATMNVTPLDEGEVVYATLHDRWRASILDRELLATQRGPATLQAIEHQEARLDCILARTADDTLTHALTEEGLILLHNALETRRLLGALTPRMMALLAWHAVRERMRAGQSTGNSWASTMKSKTRWDRDSPSTVASHAPWPQPSSDGQLGSTSQSKSTSSVSMPSMS